MTGGITNFYAGGNTARGFTSLFDSSMQGLERVYALQGGPGTGKSGLLRDIGAHMTQQGYDIWLIHCASDNDAVEGLVIPALKIGIVDVDGTVPHIIELKLPETVLQYVRMDAAKDAAQLSGRSSDNLSLHNDISQAYEHAYSSFAEALRIHDDWEAFYIANMNYGAADELTETYSRLLYGDRRLEKQSRVDHRFLGAATPNGAVDFVPNLTEGLKRYFIKGRPGSGKSTMLKKLAAYGTDHGFDVEIYHCGFDPNSLDMIIVRELGFAIFDSTAPHEYDPEHATDEIVDTYARCIKPGTDEAYADNIRVLKEQYASQMKQSIQFLSQAKSLQDELKQIHAEATDFSVVERIKNDILQDIVGLAAARS
ncbi:hypothetical protein SAMN02799630_02737 [Paenibacillus sp. UNCCL117]|nr:hypothetical protein SAMN04488602_107231 [Paenibacillus sp. cl123]SFW40154.1 hypothetical protein SAMN02799630_02737 [Paenibacillus sp. UNCCL117]